MTPYRCDTSETSRANLSQSAHNAKSESVRAVNSRSQRCGRALLEHENLALGALDQRANVIRPLHHRVEDRDLVPSPIVDTGDAALVAGDVVQDHLDDVRRHLNVRHAGGDRTSDVAKLPRLEADLRIEAITCSRPPAEAYT